jgi:hypothetical protein
MAMTQEQKKEILEKAAESASLVQDRILAAGLLLVLEELRQIREKLQGKRTI